MKRTKRVGSGAMAASSPSLAIDLTVDSDDEGLMSAATDKVGSSSSSSSSSSFSTSAKSKVKNEPSAKPKSTFSTLLDESLQESDSDDDVEFVEPAKAKPVLQAIGSSSGAGAGVDDDELEVLGVIKVSCAWPHPLWLTIENGTYSNNTHRAGRRRRVLPTRARELCGVQVLRVPSPREEDAPLRDLLLLRLRQAGRGVQPLVRALPGRGVCIGIRAE